MYRPFEVTGLELEYAVVDANLRPRCLVEALFRHLAGRPVSHLDCGRLGLSNEFAAHVFELKNGMPQRSLRRAETDLVRGVRRVADSLRNQFGARLLPTGMHPFMRPTETELWQRAGRKTYATYARIFPIREHGWLNVQSCQINLPFGSERQTALLNNALALLLPYLPALAASSPAYEGRLGPCVDNRLVFYMRNQRRVPEITGPVVPEYIESYRQYRREVLAPMYRAIRRKGGQRLAHEWLNSRAAILRFDRSAIEIRILDSQECVRMEVAIAAYVRAVSRWLVRQLGAGRITLPDHRVLVDDLRAVVRGGGATRIAAPHLPLSGPASRRTAQALLLRLLEQAQGETTTAERPYLHLVECRLRTGSLSERMRRILQGRRTAARLQADMTSIYTELSGCLERNEPWEG